LRGSLWSLLLIQSHPRPNRNSDNAQCNPIDANLYHGFLFQSSGQPAR
jgi:hypothetical protein